MVVLLVLTQMLGQGVDPGGEDSDLNLGRTGVAGMGCDPFPSFGTPPALTRVFCLPDTWIPGIF